jgi:hypothetical protein
VDFFGFVTISVYWKDGVRRRGEGGEEREGGEGGEGGEGARQEGKEGGREGGREGQSVVSRYNKRTNITCGRTNTHYSLPVGALTLITHYLWAH